MIFKEILKAVRVFTLFRKLILFSFIFYLLSFNSFGSNLIYSNETYNNISNTSDTFDYTGNLIEDENRYYEHQSQNTSNFSIIFESFLQSNEEKIKSKKEIINQLIQLILFMLTIIVSFVVGIFQILNPKYHQLLKVVLQNSKRSYQALLISSIIVFLTLSYNFFCTQTNIVLIVEFILLIFSIIFLSIFLYELMNYSNKSTLISFYLDSLDDIDICKEVCSKYGYPKEERGEIKVILKPLDDEHMECSVVEEIDEKKNHDIRQLTLKIQENSSDSDLESIFDILNFSIDSSEYKFFLENLSKMEEKIFCFINNKDLNYDIREKVLMLMFSCYDRLIKTAIHSEKFEFFTLVINSYEKLGKILIDLENFGDVKKLVDQIEKHSHDLNKKIFHVDYSYKGPDCIFHLICYYINKDSYDDLEVQKWLEAVGSIAEDMTEVDYKIKYNTIRTEYTSKTNSEYNPVYKIINDLEKLEAKVIEKSTQINERKINGECVIETISFILKNIIKKLIKIGDFTVTYDVYILYTKIAEDAINGKFDYSLNYILHDIHKIGNEIIKRKWFNNANSLLFYIAKLGVLAENKKITKPFSTFPDKDYWFYEIAEILKDLFEKFHDTFGKEPFEREQGDFFRELTLRSYDFDTKEFIKYYEECDPKRTIYEDLKEQP